LQNSHFGGVASLTDAQRQKLWNLTLVALFATTENLQAINCRKRLIEHSPELALHEIKVLNIIFSSPLQKHTKSPMLWQHRRWLHSKLGKVVENPDLYYEVSNDPTLPASMNWLLRMELLTVFKAAELHPRNYYAWSHARWLVSFLNLDKHTLINLAEVMFRRCQRQISDISYWSFLYQVLIQINDPDLSIDYIKRALSESAFAQGHESIWWFIRTLLAENFQNFHGNNDRILEQLEQNTDDQLCQKSIQWMNKKLRLK
jgi:hypothetical protein